MTCEDIEDAFFPNQEIDPNVTIPTPFENLLNCCSKDKGYKKLVENAIKYFTHKKASIDTEERMIILGDVEDMLSLTDIIELPIIDSSNYFAF
jgi:hypothetical protein